MPNILLEVRDGGSHGDHGGSSSSSAGDIVGWILGGLGIITLVVVVAIVLRTRARRKYLKAASAQFIQRHPPASQNFPPSVRRSSIHKPRPPPPRYMPALSVVSEPRSMNSYEPPSTILPLSWRRERVRRPVQNYYEIVAEVESKPNTRDRGSAPLTADNLSRHESRPSEHTSYRHSPIRRPPPTKVSSRHKNTKMTLLS